MPTVAIVEDDRAVRTHLVKLVESAAGYVCVGAWASGEIALPELEKTPPDIMLMDIHLPGMSGIECVAALKTKAPGVLVMMLTMFEDSERIFQALSAGASGYLVKRDVPKKLLPALKELVAGGAPMSSHIARLVVTYFQRKPTAPADQTVLTPREKEVLGLLAEGCLYKEIADQLGIGIETVRTHVQNTYQKLHVRTRTEAVLQYLRTQGPQGSL
jgi:DNA-binding NarL/FixJ family response regulator